jgi:hypothetical protein
VRRVERGAEPSREPFAPARNSARLATPPGSNSFDSLANEATQAVRVSPELLGMAREEEGGGATKAYEVPPELLVLARANKEKRAATQRAKRGAAAELDAHAEPDSASAEASSRITARPPADHHGPSVIVAESDLAPPSAVFEPPQSAVVAARASLHPAAAPVVAEQPLEMPKLRGSAGRKRVTRWVLIAACAIAVCAVSVLCGKLIRDHQLWTHPAADISLRF